MKASSSTIAVSFSHEEHRGIRPLVHTTEVSGGLMERHVGDPRDHDLRLLRRFVVADKNVAAPP